MTTVGGPKGGGWFFREKESQSAQIRRVAQEQIEKNPRGSAGNPLALQAIKPKLTPLSPGKKLARRITRPAQGAGETPKSGIKPTDSPKKAVPKQESKLAIPASFQSILAIKKDKDGTTEIVIPPSADATTKKIKELSKELEVHKRLCKGLKKNGQLSVKELAKYKKLRELEELLSTALEKNKEFHAILASNHFKKYFFAILEQDQVQKIRLSDLREDDNWFLENFLKKIKLKRVQSKKKLEQETEQKAGEKIEQKAEYRITHLSITESKLTLKYLIYLIGTAENLNFSNNNITFDGISQEDAEAWKKNLTKITSLILKNNSLIKDKKDSTAHACVLELCVSHARNSKGELSLEDCFNNLTGKHHFLRKIISSLGQNLTKVAVESPSTPSTLIFSEPVDELMLAGVYLQPGGMAVKIIAPFEDGTLGALLTEMGWQLAGQPKQEKLQEVATRFAQFIVNFKLNEKLQEWHEYTIAFLAARTSEEEAHKFVEKYPEEKVPAVINNDKALKRYQENAITSYNSLTSIIITLQWLAEAIKPQNETEKFYDSLNQNAAEKEFISWLNYIITKLAPINQVIKWLATMTGETQKDVLEKPLEQLKFENIQLPEQVETKEDKSLKLRPSSNSEYATILPVELLLSEIILLKHHPVTRSLKKELLTALDNFTDFVELHGALKAIEKNKGKDKNLSKEYLPRIRTCIKSLEDHVNNNSFALSGKTFIQELKGFKRREALDVARGEQKLEEKDGRLKVYVDQASDAADLRNPELSVAVSSVSAGDVEAAFVASPLEGERQVDIDEEESSSLTGAAKSALEVLQAQSRLPQEQKQPVVYPAPLLLSAPEKRKTLAPLSRQPSFPALAGGAADKRRTLPPLALPPVAGAAPSQVPALPPLAPAAPAPG